MGARTGSGQGGSGQLRPPDRAATWSSRGVIFQAIGKSALRDGAILIVHDFRAVVAFGITHPQFMSQHRSLRAAAGTTGAKRNVLKRFERVALLKSRGQWKDGERVTGLRKTMPPV